MHGFIFFEVNKEGSPIYRDVIRDIINSGEKNIVLILSEEYTKCVNKDFSECQIVEIPASVIGNIDDKIESKSNRGKYLSISRVEEFESFITGVVKENAIRILTTIHHYVSVGRVCKFEHMIPLYVNGSGIASDETDSVGILDQNENQIQMQQQATLIQELKNEIQDKKVYIDSILSHATNLDNELEKYKSWYDKSEQYGERVEKLEKINEKCTQLYKESLEKMDKLLVENLDLKKRTKRK